MGEKRDGLGDIPAGERMPDIGSAMMSGMGQKLTGIQWWDRSGAEGRPTEADAEALTREWPKPPRHVVE